MSVNTQALIIAVSIMMVGGASACEYSNYVATLYNYESFFEDAELILAEANQSTDPSVELEIHPVCGRSDKQNQIGLFLVNGSVRSVGNSVTFDVKREAEAYMNDLLSYFSADFEVVERTNIPGDDGDFSQVYFTLDEKKGDTWIELSMVTEYEFGQFMVYLESHQGVQGLNGEERP